MKQQVIVFKKPQKPTITVRIPAANMLEAAHKEALAIDPNAVIMEADTEQSLADRYFREAWELKEGKIEINRAKAEEIHLINLRRARNKALKVLDVEALKVISDSVKLQEVEDKKQKLRDLPQTVDLKSPATLDDLKNVMPEELL